MVISHSWIAYLGIILTCIGTNAAIFFLLRWPDSPLHRFWNRYTMTLERELRFLFIELAGEQLARYQLLCLVLALMVAAILEEGVFLLVAGAVVVLPFFWLRRQRAKKIIAIEKKLDSWLLVLANALKASPSLGEAIASSIRTTRSSLQPELDLMLKEVNLGTPMDQALQQMSRRIGSRTLSTVLMTIQVARRSGGNLPKTLSQSAASLREMARLETVVRAKTADGKTQAYVLSSVPFVLLCAIHFVDPNWLRPLTETPLGLLLVTISLGLWAAAVLMVRRILAVDI